MPQEPWKNDKWFVSNEGHMDALALVDTFGVLAPHAMQYLVREAKKRANKRLWGSRSCCLRVYSCSSRRLSDATATLHFG
jgi:hypothetical protein